jgi:DNA-binding NarL/FixJ family response regulator
LLTTAETIEEHRADRPNSARVDAFVAVVENRPFLGECIQRSVQSALSVPVTTHSTLLEFGAQPNEASAELVVLSLIEASGQACANVLKDLSEFASGRTVIALASANDADLARAAIRSGAKGLIPVTMGFEIAIEVMRFVLAGGTYVPPDCLLITDPLRLPASTTLPQVHILTRASCFWVYA